jgi:aspartate kinase
MRVIVQKYGGKCVEPGGNDLITAERIMETRDMGDYPVVVVSAMGRELRDLDDVALRDAEELRRLGHAHFFSTAELVRLVLSVDKDIEPRELDAVMSCGEIISTVRMAHILKSKGYSSIALSGGQVGLYTDGFFGHARVINTDIHRLVDCLDRPMIPLVAGFQGVWQDTHAVTTLGEGGSDYTAVCLAYALLNHQRTPLQEPIELGGVEIYKEVDGVMTANPANFPSDLPVDHKPRMLRHLTYDELCAMSQYGADVIQAESARMARRYSIGIAIRNYAKPQDPGTVVASCDPGCGNGLVTGIADMPNLVAFSVPGTGERESRRIAELLSIERVNAQVLPVKGGAWKFGVKREKYRDVAEIVVRLLKPQGLSPVFEQGQWALVTLVGEGLRTQTHTFGARVLETLKHVGVPVDGEITDTLSYSVLVPEAARKAAVLALHDRFVVGE